MFDFLEKNPDEKTKEMSKKIIAQEEFCDAMCKIIPRRTMDRRRENLYNRIYNDIVASGKDLSSLITDTDDFIQHYSDEKYIPLWQAILDVKKNYSMCEYVERVTKVVLSIESNLDRLKGDDKATLREKFGTIDEYNIGKEDNVLDVKPFYDFAKKVYLFVGLSDEQFENNFIDKVGTSSILKKYPFPLLPLHNFEDRLKTYNEEFLNKERIAQEYENWKNSTDKNSRYEYMMGALESTLLKLENHVNVSRLTYLGNMMSDKNLCIELPDGKDVFFNEVEELIEITRKLSIERIYGSEERLEQILKTYNQIREMEHKKTLDLEKTKEFILKGHTVDGVQPREANPDDGFLDEYAYESVECVMSGLGKEIGEDIANDFLPRIDEMVKDKVEIEFRYRRFKDMQAINCDQDIKNLKEVSKNNVSKPKIDSVKID